MINFSAFAVEKAHFFAYPVLIVDQTKKAAEKNLPPRLRILPLINASGSGEFTKTQLLQALQGIKPPIYIVDLREESHGFINNETPVSWYGKRDWLNKGLSLEAIQNKEAQLRNKLQQQKKVVFIQRDKIANDNSKNENGLWGTPKVLMIHEVASEEKLIKSLGFNYKRIPVTDHLAPTEYEVKDFLNFYRQLPNHAWLHIHCHGGAGRTTTFLTMVDILKNGQGTSLKVILTRQQKVGGSDLLDVDTSRPQWFVKAAQVRLEFLKKFYDYVHSGSYAKGISWQGINNE